MTTLENATGLVGRALMSLIFLGSGIEKIGDFAGTQALMARAGMPATGPLLVAAIVLLLGGGLSLLAGWRARWGAAALIVFLIPATAVFHLDLADTNQFHHFTKNLAILGGLLLAIRFGAGGWSLDRLAGRA